MSKSRRYDEEPELHLYSAPRRTPQEIEAREKNAMKNSTTFFAMFEQDLNQGLSGKIDSRISQHSPRAKVRVTR